MLKLSISGRQIIPLLSLLLLATAAVLLDGSSTDAVVLLVSLSVLVVCTLPAILQKTYRIYEPLTFVIASVLLGCSLKAFYLVSFYGSNETIDGKLLLDLNIGNLIFGALVLLCGLSFFSVGYLYAGVFKFKRNDLAKKAWSFQRAVLWSTVLLMISASGFFAFIVSSGISFDGIDSLSAKRFRDDDGVVTASRTGSLHYLYYRMALLAKLPLYVLFIIKLKRGFSMISLPGFLLLSSGFLSVFVPFFVNNRAGILLPMVDIGIISLMVLGRLNLKIAISTGLLAIGFVIIGGLLRSEAGFSGIYDQIFGGRYLVDLTKTAHIVNAFSSSEDRLQGITLMSWLFQILPFLQHPNPELMNMGFYLGYEVFGYLGSGVPPGVVAELFINFGWLGVTLGMALVGFALKSLYLKYGTALSSSEYVLIYALASTRLTIFLFNNGVSIALLKTGLDLVALLGLFFMIRVSQSAQQRINQRVRKRIPKPMRRPRPIPRPRIRVPVDNQRELAS